MMTEQDMSQEEFLAIYPNYKPNIRHNGSKSCPACGKTISENKEMCFACVQKFGSLESFEAHKAMDAIHLAEASPAASPEKKKRVRKPKAEGEAPKPRKPRAKKTVAAVI